MTRILFILILLVLQTASLHSQNRSQGRPFIRNFEPIEYEAENQNWAFIQAPNGLVYVANTGGILEFDGSKWRKFRPSNDGVPLSFSMGPDSLIYVVGTSLFGTLKADSVGFTYFNSLAEKFPKNYEMGFAWSAIYYENALYFHNSDDILKWDGDQLTIIEGVENIKLMCFDESNLYVSTIGQTYIIKNDQLEKLNWPSSVHHVRSIDFIAKGKTLISTFDNGAFWLDNGRITPVPDELNSFFKENFIQTVLVLPDGNILFGTKKGGVLATNGDLIPQFVLNQSTGLQDDDVKKLFLDSEMNIWIGKNQGISKIEYPIEFTYHDVLEESIGQVEDMRQVNEQFYLGTLQGTFEYREKSNSDLLKKGSEPTFVQVPNSSVDNFALGEVDSRLLFGGINGLQLLDDEKALFLDKRIPRKLLTSIRNPNVVYAGLKTGVKLIEFENKKIKSETVLDLPTEEYRGIAETKNGDLWFTTIVNGVYFVEMEDDMSPLNIHHFNTADGLPSERDNLVYNVDDQIYFTTHKGIYVFDSLTHRFKPDSTFGDIYGNGTRFVYSFYYDGKDEVWLNAFEKRETGHAVKQSDGTWSLENNKFTTMNKMLIYEIYSQEDGVAWFGGSGALVRYEPSKYKPERKPFKSKVRKVLLDNDSVVFGGSGNHVEAVFSSKSRNMRFEVAALTFRNSAVIDYQYQLVGLDNGWSDWSKETFRIYTNLSHGSYQFKVRAKNEFDEISEEDTYAFVILPFWYETWWFGSLLGLIIVGIAFQIIRYFSQRKLIKKVEEMAAVRQVEKEKDEAIIREKQKGIESIIKAQEEERQRIAKDLHDGIVQEIGSNIIRWRNLFSSDKPKTEDADQLIDSLENSNAELRALSHQMMPKALSALGVIAAIEGLLEESLKPVEIQVEFENFGIIDRLPENMEITLYRVCQELIQNIVKHSQASQVNVQLFKVGPDVNLIVEDNGVGFDMNEINEGIGLHNIKSRLDPLDGTVNFEPSPQKGTLVTVKIPLTNHV